MTEEVTVGVLLDPIKVLAGAIGQFLIEAFLQEENFVRLNADVAGLAKPATSEFRRTKSFSSRNASTRNCPIAPDNPSIGSSRTPTVTSSCHPPKP